MSNRIAVVRGGFGATVRLLSPDRAAEHSRVRYATRAFSSHELEPAKYDSVALRYIAENEHRDHDSMMMPLAGRASCPLPSSVDAPWPEPGWDPAVRAAAKRSANAGGAKGRRIQIVDAFNHSRRICEFRVIGLCCLSVRKSTCRRPHPTANWQRSAQRRVR
jgi:hypothetical protein